ncbi:hypothetical protein [uncultured Leuconostoc sp.]|uniref:hypothetical protein n=1 Tax=uncultured Leuconostoc sp. TaxID=173262 RepID=UPI0025DC9BF3|nr:hypothetical protein [uncultured Leuconostoc sp.]
MEKNNTLDKLNNMLEAKKAEEKPRKIDLNDINDDVQVLLEYAKSMSDYIERINDNQTVANREMIKSDYLGNEMVKVTTAIIMLNNYLDQAVKLLEGK